MNRDGHAGAKIAGQARHPSTDANQRSAIACSSATRLICVPESSENEAAVRDRLTIEHLPIVRLVARRIKEKLPPHVPMDDLISAGIVGLLDAAEKFDPERSVGFRTYAQCRIRGAILDSLRALDWSPRSLRQKGRIVQQVTEKLNARFQRPPEEQEIADELNVDLVEYQKLRIELNGLSISPLESTVNDDLASGVAASLPAKLEDDPLFRYLDTEMRDLVAKAVERLPRLERLVVTLRYYEEATIKEIALGLRVKESYVAELHLSGILQLREHLMTPWNCNQPGIEASYPGSHIEQSETKGSRNGVKSEQRRYRRDCERTGMKQLNARVGLFGGDR